MSERVGYIVVEFRQGDALPTDTLPSSILHFDQADAEFERDNHALTAEHVLGRRDRYVVCKVTEVES